MLGNSKWALNLRPAAAGRLASLTRHALPRAQCLQALVNERRIYGR